MPDRGIFSKKILLVNPNQMKPVVTPVALDYIGEELLARGYEVEVLDFAFSGDYKEALAQYFRENNPGAVGITVRNTDDCYYTSQDFVIPRIKEIITEIKRKTRAPLILGGIGLSLMPEKILSYCEVDLGIQGEGEESFPALLDKLFKGEDYSHIPGLVYKVNGEFKRNLQVFINLERLPYFRRIIVDNLRYLKEGGMVGIETKRGCDQACIYCADPLSKGRKIRLRPPSKVVDEIEALFKRGVNYLHTCDSEFNLPLEHSLEVCQEIIRRNLGDKIYWYAYASPIPFPEELAYLMKKAGCAGIDFGVDSGSNTMLRNLGRSFSVDDLKRTAKICHQYGITFMYDLLLGGPGETKETVKETIDLMKELNPSRVGVALGMRIYPGSTIGEWVKKEGVGEGNKNLFGRVNGNEDFFAPIFYLSSKLGSEIGAYISRWIEGDKRFFFASTDEVDSNYNYNENSILVEAIKKGYRGAYWDILRRIAETEKGSGLKS